MNWQRVVLAVTSIGAIVLCALLLPLEGALIVIPLVLGFAREIDHKIDVSMISTAKTGDPPGTYIGTTLLLLVMGLGFMACGGSQVMPDPEFSGSVEGSAVEGAYQGEASAVMQLGPLEAKLIARANISDQAQLMSAYLVASYLGALSVHVSIDWDLGCEVADVCLGLGGFEHCFPIGDSICPEPAAPASADGG